MKNRKAKSKAAQGKAAMNVAIGKDMLERIEHLARDNHHSVNCEIVRLLAWAMSSENRACRAKIAIVAGTREEARAHAKNKGLRTDEWFYATEESSVGRYVRFIEAVGTYHRHKRLKQILTDLNGGIHARRAAMMP